MQLSRPAEIDNLGRFLLASVYAELSQTETVHARSITHSGDNDSRLTTHGDMDSRAGLMLAPVLVLAFRAGARHWILAIHLRSMHPIAWGQSIQILPLIYCARRCYPVWMICAWVSPWFAREPGTVIGNQNIF